MERRWQRINIWCWWEQVRIIICWTHRCFASTYRFRAIYWDRTNMVEKSQRFWHSTSMGYQKSVRYFFFSFTLLVKGPPVKSHWIWFWLIVCVWKWIISHLKRKSYWLLTSVMIFLFKFSCILLLYVIEMRLTMDTKYWLNQYTAYSWNKNCYILIWDHLRYFNFNKLDSSRDLLILTVKRVTKSLRHLFCVVESHQSHQISLKQLKNYLRQSKELYSNWLLKWNSFTANYHNDRNTAI